jgi:hypothetical protein
MMEREWVYTVPGPTQAGVAIKKLDPMPTNVLVGLGVFACSAPTRWYVFANTENPSPEQAAFIQDVLSRVGTPADRTIHDILVSKPIFTVSGRAKLILTALETVDADGYSPRRSN